MEGVITQINDSENGSRVVYAEFNGQKWINELDADWFKVGDKILITSDWRQL